MKKLLVLSAVLGILAAAVVVVSPTEAAAPYVTDINGAALHDGDLISANQSAGDPDIFIIKIKPFDSYNGVKRLFLNPAIFGMYAHLGGFERVRQVSFQVRESFVTSGLFRNCESNDQKVWATEVTGEDDGILHHVEMTGVQAVSEDAHFFDKVFCINNREDAFYVRSIHPYTRLADVPRYYRGPRGCMVRPACLDSEPRCLMPEPSSGWCPTPTPTPLPPTSLYTNQQFGFSLVFPASWSGYEAVPGVNLALQSSGIQIVSFPIRLFGNVYSPFNIGIATPAQWNSFTYNTSDIFNIITRTSSYVYFWYGTPSAPMNLAVGDIPSIVNSFQLLSTTPAPTPTPTPLPTPTPGYGTGSIIGSVTVAPQVIGNLLYYSATVTAYSPNSCTGFTTYQNAPLTGNRFDITMVPTSIPAPNGGVCIQSVQIDTENIQLHDANAMAPGTYQVYVNGQYWTSFDAI